MFCFPIVVPIASGVLELGRTNLFQLSMSPLGWADNRSNLSFQGSSCSIDEVVDQFQLSSEAICFPMVISKCKWGSWTRKKNVNLDFMKIHVELFKCLVCLNLELNLVVMMLGNGRRIKTCWWKKGQHIWWPWAILLQAFSLSSWWHLLWTLMFLSINGVLLFLSVQGLKRC